MQAVTALRAGLLALLLLAQAGAPAAEAPRPLAAGLEAMRAGDWESAARRARADGPAAADVIEWHRLRAGRGTAAEVTGFLARNPDWPGLPLLRRRSEEAIAAADPATVRAFFAARDPQTGAGALAYAASLEAAGETGAAQAEVVRAWRTLPLSEETHARVLARHGALLAPHHTARLDMALWQGWEENARAMRPLVPEGWRALAAARLALHQDAPGVTRASRRCRSGWPTTRASPSSASPGGCGAGATAMPPSFCWRAATAPPPSAIPRAGRRCGARSPGS